MHYLAKNMAEKKHQRVQDVCKDDYVETFFYSDVHFGKDKNDDIVTVKGYAEVDFVKCISNNACICSDRIYQKHSHLFTFHMKSLKGAYGT